jgi:hypothetical protein
MAYHIQTADNQGPRESSGRIRLRGLVDALVFARIPAFCALIVAVASPHPNGRLLAISLGLASLCLGVAAHAPEVILGRPRTTATTT